MSPFRKKVLTQVGTSLGILAFLIAGIVFFGFSISRVSGEIAATRQELALRTASLQSLASLRLEYANQAEPYLNVLHNVVPLKDELIDLTKDFQAIAAAERLDYGFTFLGEKAATESELGAVRFNVSLEGGLNQLLNFVKNLQNFRYLISLETIQLNQAVSTVKMNVRGNVFFR